jgi:hypothetical protein
MEQRPLRLGDIVDDYCPRERRITNHAIVALVGPSIRQTRCATCDAEHIYKEAKVPRRKKTDATGALYDQVLADGAPGQLVPPKADEPVEMAAASDRAETSAVNHDADSPTVGHSNGAEPEPEPSEEHRDDGWAAHRPLIRAQLPRTEGEPPTPRPIPEFTMHQRRTRGAQMFRQGWHGNDNANGNQRHSNGFRPGRSAHGQGQGQGHGNGPNHNRHNSGGRSGRRQGPSNKRPR